MDEALAILGRQPELGLAELESLYGSDNVSQVNEHAARMNIMPCSIDFNRLGGTIKLCKMLTVLDTTKWKEIEQFLVDICPKQSQLVPPGKLYLGLSTYDLQVAPQQLLATGLKIKRSISSSKNRPVRLIPNNHDQTELSTAQVLHNKLLSDNGWELICARDGRHTLIAQTLFIQDIESYTRRDRGRPKRDARNGMLPPKLAQIIINLAIGPQEFTRIRPELSNNICLKQEDNLKMHEGRKNTRLLDPFCGTGVILQEASLMGYAIQGSDIERRMVEYTQQNLAWVAQHYELENKDHVVDIGDATTHRWTQPIHAVASETYLGRPFTAQPSAQVLTQTISDCNMIIKKSLQNIANQLASGTRLCLAVPAWQVKSSSFRHLPLIDQIEELGYNLISFEHVKNKNLLYYRADQFVARQLLVITRK